MSVRFQPVPTQMATNLEDAWINFEPNEPLPSADNSDPHPFYVKRPRDPLAELKLNLQLQRLRTPTTKYFVSGHRGCGKSTELLRLITDPDIKQHYVPFFFSIRDTADLNDVDYRDILLIIGTQLFTQFKAMEGYSLPDQLWTELNQWRGKVEEEIVTLKEGRVSGGVEAGVSAFFAKLGGSIKIEPAVRKQIRQLFENDVSGLLRILNDMAIMIRDATKKWPLVVIDDLDKLSLPSAEAIFHDHIQVMRQPLFPIIYTVSSSLFYTPQFVGVKDEALFVPNVKLHEQGDANKQDTEGVRVMNSMIDVRMDRALLTAEARGELLKMSGGVFRELARLVQKAISNCIIRGKDRLELEDAQYAASELRSGYWRILTAEQRATLAEVRDTHKMHNPDKLAPLFQILAVLEYRNGERWCDVHPVLEYLLERLDEG